MSKERANRRAAREHEAALKAAARAAEAERRERQLARKAVVKRMTTDRLPRMSRAGKQTGVLARRRRLQTSMLLTFLLAVQVLVWVLRPDWASRLAALLVSVLAAPVLYTLLFRRR